MSGGRFPSLSARDLEGTSRRVPEDLEGDPRVLLVAFDRFHQSVVDSWVEALERDAAPRAPRMRVYEIPTISARYRWARSFIDGGMVAAIRDVDVRLRTLTVYTRLDRVLAPLGLSDASEVCAVVLAPDGSIAARAVGRPTPENLAAILAAL